MKRTICVWLWAGLFAFLPGGAAGSETIELVTYYPAPGGGDVDTNRLHADAATIGEDYSLNNPAALANGTLLVWDRIGVGLGAALPAGPLHVVGRNNVVDSAIFMPGAGGTMNVGIGTATPGFHLDNLQTGQTIAYTNYHPGCLGAINSATASNIPNEIVQYYAHDTSPVAAGIGGGIGFGGKYTENTATIWAGIIGQKENGTAGNHAGYLGFYTRPNGGIWQERMRISSAGNVGIGNTYNPATASPNGQPAGNLDVNDIWLRSTRQWLSQAAGGTSVLATNGYARLSGGLILQWGTTGATAWGIQTHNFPLRFPNACLQVVATPGNLGNHGEENLKVGNFTRANFQSYGGPDERPFHWIAIGY